jgi:hypothetical protein
VKIQLCGPITGIEGWNYPAFYKAADHLRSYGNEVRSPAEHDVEVGLDTLDPDSPEFQKLLDECVEWDLDQIREWADCIVLLPGWLNSKGCEGELLEAERYGKAAYEYDPDGNIMHRYGTGAVVLEAWKPNAEWTNGAGTLGASWTTRVVDDTDMTELEFDDRLNQSRTRIFVSGATRDTEEGKLDYEGFISPWALQRFAEYMDFHAQMADGSRRASDNWQKGFPQDVLVKSLLRHVMAVWMDHRYGLGIDQDEFESDLCGVIFNAQALLHQLVKPDVI